MALKYSEGNAAESFFSPAVEMALKCSLHLKAGMYICLYMCIYIHKHTCIHAYIQAITSFFMQILFCDLKMFSSNSLSVHGAEA